LRLTVYSDYALRLLMYLAVKDDGSATIAEVAKAYGISKNHLMKVAYQLGVAGYVETVRGRGGGLRLAKPLEAINLGEICATPSLTWRSSRASADRRWLRDLAVCALRTALKRACTAFTDVLDEYTLKDLAKPRSALRALLSIPPAPRAEVSGSKGLRH
jgi:Rrf2 family nitric oxide-sensitive transcriptional repressor